MATDRTNQVSFGLSRPGLLPGHQVKRRLVCLDTTHLVASYFSIYAWFFAGLYYGDICYRQRHPNGWLRGVPADLLDDLIDFILISVGIVVGLFIVTNLNRFIAKQLAFLSGWFTTDEIRTFPIDTDGRIWSLRSPKASLKPWPLEWQEQISTSSSDLNE